MFAPVAVAVDANAAADATNTFGPNDIPFDRRYMGYDSHVQRVRRSFVIMRVAGRVPNRVSTRTSLKQLDSMAQYMGALFCPWSIDRRPQVRNWDQLIVWYKALDEMQERQAQIKSMVKQMVRYCASRFTKRVLKGFRMREAASKCKRPGHTGTNAERAAADAADQQRDGPGDLGVHATLAAAPRRAAPIPFDRVADDAAEVLRRNDGRVYNTVLVRPPEAERRAAVSSPECAALEKTFASQNDVGRQEQRFNTLWAMRNGDDMLQGNGTDRMRARMSALSAAERESLADLHARQRVVDRAELAMMENTLFPRQREVYTELKLRLTPRVVHHTAMAPCELMHLQGGPGTGKSRLIDVLARWAVVEGSLDGQGVDSMRAAFTGFAASHIGGITCHRAFGLMTPNIATMNKDQRSAMRQRLLSVPFILIDEVSMIGARFFAKLIMRIEDLLYDGDFVPPGDNDADDDAADPAPTAPGPKFGEPGFPPLILLGDFGQLDPVKDKPLYLNLTRYLAGLREGDKAVINAAEKAFNAEIAALAANAAAHPAAGKHRRPNYGDEALVISGLRYFSKFKTAVIDEQIRAEDPVQKAMITKMVNEGTVPDLIANPHLKFLDNSMTDEELAAWRWVPIVVACNDRRRIINLQQGIAFAAQQGLPLIVWRKQISGDITPEIEADAESLASRHWQIFVPGAPAMLGVNVVPHLCLSNGTSAVMHSLTWTADLTERELSKIRAAKPGEIVEVEPPMFINVVVTTSHELPLELVARIVDPVTGATKFKHVLPMQCWDVRDERKHGVCVMPAHASHMVELGFAFTFYKVQGATLAKVILDFNFKYHMQCKFSAVYVGLSRVRNSADLRLLPSVSATCDTWLAELRWSAELKLWMDAALGERERMKAAMERRKMRVGGAAV